MGEEPENQDHPDREEDLVPQVGSAERIDERGEHAHLRYFCAMITMEPPAASIF